MPLRAASTTWNADDRRDRAASRGIAGTMPPLSCPAARSFRLAARGDFDPERSDVDFLVEFDRTHPDALSLSTYFGLKEALEGLLGRSVDLVEPGAVRNPYLKASIEGSREPVFAA